MMISTDGMDLDGTKFQENLDNFPLELMDIFGELILEEMFSDGMETLTG